MMTQLLLPASRLPLAFLLLFAVGSWADAHFLWLKSDVAKSKPQAVLFFGASAVDEAYHLPESLAGTQVWYRTPDGKRREVKTRRVDTDQRIGLVAPITETKRPLVLESASQYGVFTSYLLTYYPKHILVDNNEQLVAAGPSPELTLDLVPKAVSIPSPSGRGKGEGALEVAVLWKGKPKAGVEVNYSVGDNEPVTLETDASGKVTFQPKSEGLVSVVASVFDETQNGELDGDEYSGADHYATLTFPWRKGKAKKGLAKNQAPMPSLPEPVSSFGAAVSDGYLYVYGGHTGTEHDHSAANLSRHFRRVPLEGGHSWEDLPMQRPLQGLALVAYDGKLYRMGGMNARNTTTDDEEDLHSTAEFAAYDPATNQWTSLAPLPAPRSSHDAVVFGNKLYVTGGWTLSGPRDGAWLDDSLVYDFTDPSAGWQELPKQDFQRRALAAGEWHGKLVALGGMDENADVSRRVDFFDPTIGRWSQGPELPGSDMSGFGVSAWNLADHLYVSGFSGRVFKLADDGSQWEEVAKLAHPRFFHQLVPATAPDALLAVGGASRDGHLATIELLIVNSADHAVSATAGR